MNPVSLLSAAVTSVLGGHTQTTRLLKIHTPLGTDALFAEDLNAWEAIGPHVGPDLGEASLGPARAGLRLVVHAFSQDAHLELKALIGQPALVELLCQDSREDLRPWHGHIVAAAFTGSDGGLARYRLVIEPWLSVLQHRVDSYVFQDMSVPQIIDEVFGDHADQGRLAPAWRWELADESVYPRRSLCVQYQESDLDFVQRLLLEEGLFCWWAHEGLPDDDTLGSHTLVISDHNDAFAENIQPQVRFTHSDHTFEEDSLTRWRNVQRTASARVDLASWDHRSRGTRPVQAAVAGSPLAELGISDTPGAYAYEGLDQGERLASRQAEALGALRQRMVGRGPWRRAEAGTTFTLRDHPRHTGADAAADTFVILAAQHRARNNFRADERARLSSLSDTLAREVSAMTGNLADTAADAQGPAHPDDERPLHEAALLVQPLAVPVRLAAAVAETPLATDAPRTGFGVLGGRVETAGQNGADSGVDLFDPDALRALGQPDPRLHRRPTVHGSQTALVVGNGPVHTDRDARVKVQFHWQRGGQSSHRLSHPMGENAPGSEGSFTWVRVGQTQAGTNHGAVFIPRVGQEVAVAFIGGDIDRPVIVGAAYNGQGLADAQGNQAAGGAAGAVGDAPPWFPGETAAGERQGHQHAAVMLGYKSQELASSSAGMGGFTQMVFDDTPAANRIELSANPTPASMMTSRLQLGHLLQQEDNQRLAPRGHGLDLSTGGHGALRAGTGLLITAHPETPSTAGGLQLQARDPLQQLQNAQELVHTLAETAQGHQAKLATEPDVKGATAEDKAKQLPTEQGMHALKSSLEATATKDGGGNEVDTAGIGGGESPQSIDGGWGTVPAWERPDLTLSAPAGIGLFTPAHAITSSAAQITLSAGQDINSMAQGAHATSAKEGAILFTYGKATNTSKPNTEVGIALHAATGSLQASANTSTADLAASAAVEVVSTTANVLVSAPSHVLLTAAGAALDIQSGSITLKGPGNIQFKASQKTLTGGASASAPKPNLLSANLTLPAAFSGRMDLYDVFTQQAFEAVRYTAKLADGRFLSGTLDRHGRSRQVYAGEAQEMTVLVGESKPEWDVIVDYDDIQNP